MGNNIRQIHQELIAQVHTEPKRPGQNFDQGQPEIPRNVCKRCNHQWRQRKAKASTLCPGCHSSIWQFTKEERPAIKPNHGGAYVLALKVNYDGISEYFKANGDIATMQKYGCTRPTLERLLAGGYGGHRQLSEGERAIMISEICNAGVAELRREVRELKESYAEFVQLVAGQITAQIAKSLSNIHVQIPERLLDKEAD